MAVVATLRIPVPGRYELMIGEGGHAAGVWRLSPDLLRKLAREFINAELSK